MSIRERGKKPKYEVRMRVNGELKSFGTYEDRRTAELIELIWQEEKPRQYIGLTESQIIKAERNGLSYNTLYHRLKVLKWSNNKAVTTPLNGSYGSKRNRKVKPKSDAKDLAVKYMLKHMQASLQQLKNEFPHVSDGELKNIWNTFQ